MAISGTGRLHRIGRVRTTLRVVSQIEVDIPQNAHCHQGRATNILSRRRRQTKGTVTTRCLSYRAPAPHTMIGQCTWEKAPSMMIGYHRGRVDSLTIGHHTPGKAATSTIGHRHLGKVLTITTDHRLRGKALIMTIVLRYRGKALIMTIIHSLQAGEPMTRGPCNRVRAFTRTIGRPRARAMAMSGLHHHRLVKVDLRGIGRDLRTRVVVTIVDSLCQTVVVVTTMGHRGASEGTMTNGPPQARVVPTRGSLRARVADTTTRPRWRTLVTMRTVRGAKAATGITTMAHLREKEVTTRTTVGRTTPAGKVNAMTEGRATMDGRGEVREAVPTRRGERTTGGERVVHEIQMSMTHGVRTVSVHHVASKQKAKEAAIGIAVKTMTGRRKAATGRVKVKTDMAARGEGGSEIENKLEHKKNVEKRA